MEFKTEDYYNIAIKNLNLTGVFMYGKFIDISKEEQIKVFNEVKKIEEKQLVDKHNIDIHKKLEAIDGKKVRAISEFLINEDKSFLIALEAESVKLRGELYESKI